jgi:hypothetical protein
MATRSLAKHECLNPRSGRAMMIDSDIYLLFSKAIKEILKAKKQLNFTDLVDHLHEYFNKKKIKFDRSVDWYAVTVRNDLEARGVISTFTEKGKKFNSLSK